MATTYEYILKLTDKSSSVVQKIVGSSTAAVAKFNELTAKSKEVDRSVRDFGDGIGTLQKKIALLSAERDIIDPSNLSTIRAYNKEIETLTGKLNKLENAGKGSLLKKAFSGLDSVTGGLISNPLVVGATAAAASVKSAMNFDQGMAKINITAQLDDKSLSELRGKLVKIAKDNKVDIVSAPDGFEKILSQLGDVEQSLPIFDAAIKGQKAGFVDLDTTAAALAQTMSILGSERATAMDVLDVFFAAKRVGAGEFADFARYMPNLIAAADNLGVAYKEVAGVYAYMTGKGQSAERAAVLMENMFSVLGRGEIRKNLEAIGVQVYDDAGKIRGMVDVFGDLKKVTASLTDEKRASLIESLGIVDKEAKNAISVMLSDTLKLAHSIDEVTNSSGETAKNMEFSRNSVMAATEVWNKFKGIAVDLGTAALPLVRVGLYAVSGILSVVSPVLNAVVWLLGAWYDCIVEGNPIVIFFTTAIAGFTVALNLAKIASMGLAVWQGIVTGATAVWTAAQWLLNTALFACPIVWVIAVVAGLVAAIIWAWNKFEGFRAVVLGTWQVIKDFGKIIMDVTVGAVQNLIGGLGLLGKAIYKLFTGDFKGAWQDAKEGAQKLFSANPIVATVEAGIQTGKMDIGASYRKGAAKAIKSKEPAAVAEDPIQKALGAAGQGNAGAVPTAPPTSITIPKGLGTKASDKGSKVVDLDKIATNAKGSTAYNAIASFLQPVRMASLGAAASVAMGATLSDVLSAPQAPAPTAGIEMASQRDGRRVQMDKFCDQIVINIQKADGQGADEIRRIVAEAINSVIDDGQTV